jgi:hypothetical protein
MSETFQCGDNAALVGYLYGECEPAERRAIEMHLAVCGACAAEVAALSSTRLQLSSWAPPEAELGFRVVSAAASENVIRPARWWTQPLPAWAQAAAAVVIFGAGLWLGVAQGTAPSSEQAVATQAETVSSAPAAAANTVSAEDLAALERRLRGEIAQMRVAAPAHATGSQASDTELLARVRALLEESEQRQQRELALRMTQVMRDVETQRRLDLAQIQGTFRQIEGVTGAQVLEQRDMLNYLMRVSQQGR